MGIAENAFNLIFAFDEIVALGYRESVNPQMIRGFIEMDSHEEKVQLAVRQVSLTWLKKVDSAKYSILKGKRCSV